jgi:nucleoside-diphosphate-sugar epimerase
MRVIVTGGSGDIGRYVLHDLLANGLSPVNLDVRPPRAGSPDIPFLPCDLMDMGAAAAAIRDCDAVIHLAAIPNPFNDPAERVMAVNMVTTYHVLEAVRLNGVPRIVYGCSESSSGFGVHRVALKPQYLPIDEEHPCWPHEVYSFTKRFGEEMVREYSHAFGIAGISLRYCWVLVDRDAEAIRDILRSQAEGRRDPKAWFGSYIAPHDVAQACRLACRFGFPAGTTVPFEAFYLTAPATFLAEPTLESLAHHFDPLPEVRDPGYFAREPFASPYDTRKAQRLLGFAAARSFREFERWERH